MQLSLPGAIHKNKTTFHTNILMRKWWNDHYGFLIGSNSIVIVIFVADFFNDRQCNKSSYVKSITYSLLPHITFIYNYLSIP